MADFISRLKREAGNDIGQYEVWYNAENLKKMREYDKGFCGGIPFFINTESGKFICGETSYEELKKWTLGEAAIPQGPSPAAGILDYRYITDGIYIGTNQCCQTHFDEKLKKVRISSNKRTRIRTCGLHDVSALLRNLFRRSEYQSLYMLLIYFAKFMNL